MPRRPLFRNPPILPLDDAFPAIVVGGGYHPNLEVLRNRRHSGVYAILDKATRRVLYVGESHTGRLYDTITRHFRKWDIPPGRDAQGRRQGGTQYNRAKVLVVWTTTTDAEAPIFQYEEIQRLKPRDNLIDGDTVAPF